MNSAFFSELLNSIADKGRQLLKRGEGNGAAPTAGSIIELCRALLSGRGEASGTALAAEVLNRYPLLDDTGKLAFFKALGTDFGPDQARLAKAVIAWQKNPDQDASTKLHFESEPRRQDLFRRLNRAPGGTAALVAMRADLLNIKDKDPALAAVDQDFAHLLSSWFNRGFLVLRRIDWSTPAIVLEKIIRYEAVHAIRDWEDLRRRIDPIDRRCYAFFHPALVDEPLIFVEVALSEAVPNAIAPLLAEARTPAPLSYARTATFYSISNCQRGLDGVSFGNFLIKQVVEELRRELPKLERFVTLSPVPGFMRWLAREREQLAPDEQAAAEALIQPDWAKDTEAAERLRPVVESLAAGYFLRAKGPKGRPVDPVARFHLGNGARLERINFLGDRSPRAMRDAGGLMVNYLYDLDDIEKNHEAFVNQGEVAASGSVRKLLKSEPRSRLQLTASSSN